MVFYAVELPNGTMSRPFCIMSEADTFRKDNGGLIRRYLSMGEYKYHSSAAATSSSKSTTITPSA